LIARTIGCRNGDPELPILAILQRHMVRVDHLPRRLALAVTSAVQDGPAPIVTFLVSAIGG
jgi:hypothetical protein